VPRVVGASIVMRDDAARLDLAQRLLQVAESGS
jgi:hypothetical protein